MTPLQKLPKTVRDLSKIIVTKGFKKSPKVQKIAKSGHTGYVKELGIDTISIRVTQRLVDPFYQDKVNPSYGKMANFMLKTKSLFYMGSKIHWRTIRETKHGAI